MPENPVVRAKFTVTHHEVLHYQSGDPHVTVHLQPRCESSIPEDKRFAAATPSGELKMYITNKSAIEHLKPGRAFYLDFIPVPEGVSPYHS